MISESRSKSEMKRVRQGKRENQLKRCFQGHCFRQRTLEKFPEASVMVHTGNGVATVVLKVVSWKMMGCFW
jgi:hypothetical protein